MTDALIKRLFLLDGMALIYRAHFAMVRSPRYTSGNVCTSAVFGMTNAILDILKREQPTHIAAVFDTAAPTHRHEEYPEYKAQRDAMPEDLSSQIPLVFRLFEAFNIPVITIDGYEADDIIGTLAHQAEQQQFTTYMVTPDKDFQQLLTDNIYIYRPGRQGSNHEVVGVPEVLEKWGLENVRQFIDILGLMGDASDNIPGIKGIGEKTAQKLIGQFGSIENLLQSTDKLKGKQRERVEQGAEDAILSKRLATILLDVPHQIDLDSLKAKEFDKDRLSELFMELEFETFGKRMLGKSFSVGATKAKVVREKREAEIQQQLFFDEPVDEKTIHNSPHEYHTITTAAERADLVEKLMGQKRICFDTETTGLNPREAEPLGLAFAIAPNQAYYVVCGESAEATNEVLEQFRPVFENEAIEKVGHNLKYDISLLKWQGIEVRGALFDTMLAHSMKEPEMRHGLDYLAKLYLGYTPIPTSDLIGPKGKDQKNMRDVPLEQLAQYACEDADVTWRVNEVLRDDIEKRGVSQVCYEVECPLIPVLVDMEFEGIRLDVDSLAVYSKHLEGEIADLTARIHSAAGREFNIDSPKQLGVVLFEELQIDDKPKKTATGQYSTRESELLRLSGRHEIVQDILDYRSAVKLKSTYVDQLPAAVNPKTGRLHTHYSQTWTATGRMQSNDPNLQTIPIRKARGKEIRAAFVPRNDDYLILSADYSQIELRIMAELSQDAGMIEAFTSGEDIHSVTASKVYKVDLADVTREMRDKAKTVNFGILYGISAFGLQQRLNIPRGEASELIDNYFEKYPGVQTYIDATIEFAKENGYVVTKTGRRRYLRDITSRNHSARTASERLAMNSPIQGTAADMLKLAMIKVHAALRAAELKTKMLLTVHDEIVFDLHKSEQETALPLIEEAMRTAFPMSVPIVVETGVGNNWLEAH
ncbi:DNA polymerase I [Rosistilla oblonga]|uniref:DNA polymerase I n=1 Tax=Rosistilla oblonga TaxID=2527990 RepID=UPI003A979454